MAPTSKKSKFTMSSSAAGSSSKPSSSKPKQAARLEPQEETLSDLEDAADEDDEVDMSGLEEELDDEDLGGGDDEFDLDAPSEDASEGGEPDTDDEIEEAGRAASKSKKTASESFQALFHSLCASVLIVWRCLSAERKRRATSPSTFGSLMTSILHAQPTATTSTTTRTKSSKASTSQVQSSNILSLAPSVRKTIAARTLEGKAKRVLQATRHEREDNGRIRDVLTGWGGREDGIGGQEWERNLRKTAQKGVVRLFNTILLSAEKQEEAEGERKGLKAPEPTRDPKKSLKKEKDNILGRGGKKEARVTKEGFEALLKGGGA